MVKGWKRNSGHRSTSRANRKWQSSWKRKAFLAERFSDWATTGWGCCRDVGESLGPSPKSSSLLKWPFSPSKKGWVGRFLRGEKPRSELNHQHHRTQTFQICSHAQLEALPHYLSMFSQFSISCPSPKRARKDYWNKQRSVRTDPLHFSLWILEDEPSGF